MGLFNHDEAKDAHAKVNSDVPRDQITHELIAGAAGFAAMHLLEQNKEAAGDKEHHKLMKEALAGFAAAEVEKLFESGVYSHLDKEKAKKMAQEQASHLYDQQHGAQPV
ncbi:MAG: DUF3759 domain-containing protein [Actinobacteria bacterium]|nr:DUF3759 domain-containing protein [Actinomycetota bacterium]MBO0837240.1 DUF3759 domain-containing protein [Actinomycetota bacterium]